MPIVGWHASHEQIAPSQLLRDIQAAEQAGFQAAWSSDHFTPWSRRQGESGFALSWLGAAMATTSFPVGVVSTPGQRYHPAIVAQALATLAEMFPGRLSAGFGSGEFMNEHVTGQPWPHKDVRNARLKESVEVIRALLTGEEVTHHGLVEVDRARLWTLPEQQPRMLALAVSEATARWAGEWADGLVTIWQPPGLLKRLVAAFRENGGEDKPLAVQIHISWAPDEEQALDIAFDQWRSNMFPAPLCWNLATAEEFDLAAEYVRPEDMYRSVVISSEAERFITCVREAVDLGFDEVYLHHVGQQQQPFLDTFGRRVLPELV